MKISFFIYLLIMHFSGKMIFGQSDLPENFNIYLLPDDIKTAQIPKLDAKKLKPKGAPVVSLSDIQSYLKNHHTIRFRYQGADRLKKLIIPPDGKPFIVFVGDTPIYTGAFFDKYSNRNFKSFAIDLRRLEGDLPAIKIAKSFPDIKKKTDLDEERQNDARADRLIVQSLADAGVLYEELVITGKCLKIVNTLNRSGSQIFTFAAEKVYKGKYTKPEISFGLGGKSSDLLLEALEAEGNSFSDKEWKFHPQQEITLYFEQQIHQNPQIVFKSFSARGLREVAIDKIKIKMPLPEEIARVEVDRSSYDWYQPDELLKALPRFVAVEGEYLNKQTLPQQGSFILKNGKIVRWMAAGKSFLSLYEATPDGTREQLFVFQ